MTQTMVRIVGLSATLPNYKDVGEFLRCVSLSFLISDLDFHCLNHSPLAACQSPLFLPSHA
jgi:hypothetical protein